MWRYVPRNAHPLDVGFVLRADGRWNRYGEYGCLYTSLSRTGALAEYAKLLTHVGIPPADDAQRDLVTIRVHVRRVLDLCTPSILRSLNITTGDITGDNGDSLELCRTLADNARSDGYNAILSPSAAAGGEKNLNIYIDGGAQDILLALGSIREPLNY
ncbi:MAG TPA: RES family NAD+ phosphorylase [Gemmatimonadaceae bacterium]|nr:RES family NAD+ phosphorylase [Gemmatimonadaceae bacterium]